MTIIKSAYNGARVIFGNVECFDIARIESEWFVQADDIRLGAYSTREEAEEALEELMHKAEIAELSDGRHLHTINMPRGSAPESAKVAPDPQKGVRFGQWISTDKAMPAYGQDVLLLGRSAMDHEFMRQKVGYYTPEDQWYSYSNTYGPCRILETVAYWMPLPEEPEK